MSSDKDPQSIEQARELVERAYEAQKTLATFSQEKIDEIVGAMARVALEESYRLGEMAQLETGYGSRGRQGDKESDFQPNRFTTSFEPMRTVGVIRQTESIIEVASPRGVVAAIIPSTNPDLNGDLQNPHLNQGARRGRPQPAPIGYKLHQRRRARHARGGRSGGAARRAPSDACLLRLSKALRS